MNIPTYKANVGQYNVPSMNNAGEQHNAETIYQGLANVSNAITNTAINMYELEKAEEAKIEGAKAASSEGFDLNNLPTANTAGQQIYNQAAIEYYANSFHTDTSREIARIAGANKNNAAQFLVESDSYLKGVSSNIPEHLKDKILYPIQVKADSHYNTILKEQIKNQEKYISEQNMFDLQTKKNEIANLNFATNDQKIIESNNVALAEFSEKIRSMVGVPGGITAEYGATLLQSATKGASMSFVYNTLKDASMDAQQTQVFVDSIVNGNTKNLYLNSLSPEERIDVLTSSLDKYYKLEEESKKADERLDDVANESIDGVFVEFANAIASNPYLSLDEISSYQQKATAFARNSEQREKIKTFFSTDVVSSSPYAKKELDLKLAKGTLSVVDLMKARGLGLLSVDDFYSYTKELNSPYQANKKTDAWKFIENDIKMRFPNKVSEFGIELSGTNGKRLYVENSMNNFLSQRAFSNEEIYNYYNEIINSSKGVEGSEVDIPEPVKNTITAKLPTTNIQSLGKKYATTVFEKRGTKRFPKHVYDEELIKKDLVEMNPEMSEREIDVNVKKLISSLPSLN